VPTANFLKIPTLIDNLIRDINRPKKDIISLVADIHTRFEQIHPFSDGNGRIGRLIMTAMLIQANLAPAIIRQELKDKYLIGINNAQLTKKSGQLKDVISEGLILGLEILNKK
jgi:Fic family protein